MRHRPHPSETCNGSSFSRARFKYRQQPSNFQRFPQLRAELTKHEPSALGFCLSMRFDKCAEARAVNIIHVLKINDDPCGAGCQEIVNRRAQPGALFAERKTTFERQHMDSIHLTLCYFQRHYSPPHAANTWICDLIHNSF